MPRFKRTAGRRLLWGLLACVVVHLFLQTLWVHRAPAAALPSEPVPIHALLEQPHLGSADYDTLFLQSGLSPAAVALLLAQGESGRAQISAAQTALFAARPITCQSLIPGRITCEDLLAPAVPRAPLAPLEPGDLLITFSTHTEGWRHGHAGLAVDGGTVLEAAKLGELSGCRPLAHWASYSTLLILRVRGAPAEKRAEAVRFALDRLDGAPYSFLSGLGPVKLPESPAGVQCAYLPWCAWQHCGYDLDADGGRIVTVADLAASPLLEVVQVCGLDPALFLGRAAGTGEPGPSTRDQAAGQSPAA